MRWLTLLMLLLSRAAAEPLVHTFSIVAYDPKTGDLGVAVQSKYFGVGTVVPWVKSGVGAVATQALAKMSYGPNGLALMEQGTDAPAALEKLRAGDKKVELRQVAMVDSKGRIAVHTGAECIPWAGHKAGEYYSVQGNLLTGEEVINAMASAFEKARASAEGELAEWLAAALDAGQTAGGDRRGQQSAALLVARANAGPGGDNDRYIDLRVDDNSTPITELTRLLRLHREFYKQR